VEAVQVRGAENQEVYLINIQSALRTHLAGIEEASPRVYCRETSQYWAPNPVRSPSVQLGEKVRHGRNQAHFIGAASESARAGVDKGRGWKDHPRSAFSGLGEPTPESPSGLLLLWTCIGPFVP
jgi:hypothetical protein